MDEKEIIRLYLEDRLSMAQIANRFNVKYCTIHNILSKHKINRKSDPRRRIIDKDLLYNLYVIKKKSKPEIQKELKVCRETLDKNLK